MLCRGIPLSSHHNLLYVKTFLWQAASGDLVLKYCLKPAAK
jgi:hypothetical protein